MWKNLKLSEPDGDPKWTDQATDRVQSGRIRALCLVRRVSSFHESARGSCRDRRTTEESEEQSLAEDLSSVLTI